MDDPAYFRADEISAEFHVETNMSVDDLEELQYIIENIIKARESVHLSGEPTTIH